MKNRQFKIDETLKSIIILCVLSLFLVQCDANKGTTIVGNPSVNPTETVVSIGQLDSDGISLITIPLEIFGETEDDLEGASIDILVNEAPIISGINPQEFYQSSRRAVTFNLNRLKLGDILEFVISRADGTILKYRGTVSDEEESSASYVSGAGSGDGFLALQNRDFVEAESVYCADETSSEMASGDAFGCYLVRMISLLETEKANVILDSFDEDHLDVSTIIFEGIFDDYQPSSVFINGYDNGDRGFDSFNYIYYPDLPFNDIFSQNGVQDSLARLLDRLVQTNTSMLELQSQLHELVEDFELMEALLDKVLPDTAFAFTIPQELFSTETDLSVTLEDVKLFMAKTKLTLVGLNFQAAYDFGLNPASVLTNNGSDFHTQAVVEDLNGSGVAINGGTVDNIVFMTLLDASLITNSKQRAIDGLALAFEGLTKLNEGRQSDILDESLRNYAGIAYDLQDAVDLIECFYDSVRNPGMVNLEDYIGNSDESEMDLQLDLYEFFTHPPDGSSVTSADPFVYSAVDGKIDAVEVFFDDFLEGIVE